MGEETNRIVAIREKSAEVGRRADELQKTMRVGRAAALDQAARELLPDHWIWEVVPYDGGAQLMVLRVG